VTGIVRELFAEYNLWGCPGNKVTVTVNVLYAFIEDIYINTVDIAFAQRISNVIYIAKPPLLFRSCSGRR